MDVEWTGLLYRRFHDLKSLGLLDGVGTHGNMHVADSVLLCQSHFRGSPIHGENRLDAEFGQESEALFAVRFRARVQTVAQLVEIVHA